MGRGKKGGGRGGKKGNAAGRTNDPDAPRKAAKRDTDPWEASTLDNAKFRAYYKAQNILPDAEWEPFMAAFREPLPTTFRITSCREGASSINQVIRDTYVPFLSGLEHEGNPLSPPRPLDWYPQGWAWQLNIAKHHIRKNEAFRKFQNFLVYETDAGNLSRQEAVSMIPPLLLDVQPHHYVLDVCAAPGSKSVQLLEALQVPRDSPSVTADRSSPGLLIANDSDAKRCHMLVHQSLHRIPAAGMMVTNHDASQMPGFRLPLVAPGVEQTVAEDEKTIASSGKKYEALLFDRILADVPCSGDGTLRKNVGIWRDWTVGNGTGLHSLQLRILLRAIALLKPGGRLVYSTCSLNPIENEAVVSSALAACSDMSLAAVPDMLPTLLRRPGLTTWQVLNNDMVDPIHPDEFDSTGLEADELKKRKKYQATLWPNGKEAERGLDRCLRIYPHLQDTGAFFVAVLVKAGAPEVVVPAAVPASEVPKRTVTDRAASPIAEEPVTKRARQEDTITDDTPAAEVKAKVEVAEDVDVSKLPADVVGTMGKTAPFKEDPFTYLSPNDEQVKTCLDFFDLDPSFPVADLLVRNADGTALRSIYFTSPIVRSLLLANSYSRMRLISCGVKVFTRQDAGKDGTYRCKWRVVSEGLEVIRPFMGPKRILQGTKETLRILMGELNVPFGSFAGTEFITRLEAMEPGSCVLEITTTGEGVATEQKLVLPLWRSKVSTSLMVEKMEKSALSLRIFGEDLTPHKAVEKVRESKKLELAAAAAATTSGEATPDTVATPVEAAVAEVVEEVKESVVVVE